MTRALKRVALSLLSLTLILTACDQIPNIDNLLPPPGIPAVDDIMEEEMRIQEIAGVAIGVVEGGVVKHLEGYGYRDLNAKAPMTPQTLIRWASISKTITAVAAMKLVRAGHLDLDKDIQDYISGWTASTPGMITMRQLLTNTSGVPHYNDSTFSYNTGQYDGSKPYDADASLDVFDNQILLFTPGSDYNYSTFGFNVAAAVIDAITEDEYNQSFPDFVDDSIAMPLGLSTLQPDYSDFRNLSPRTKGYDKTCEGIIREESTTDVSWKLGGGGWISSTEDLTTYMKALIDETILPPAWMDTVLTEQIAGGSMTGYGYGFQISGQRVGHGGWQQNGRNHMYFFPADDHGIVIMCNSEHVDLWRIFRRIANELGYSYPVSDYSLYNQLECFDDGDCDGSVTPLFAGVWRTGETDQIVRRGYSQDDFNEEWTKLSDEGYRLKDLETYRQNGERLWDGVFTKGSGRHALWRNFTTDDFNAKWQEMSDDGLRLIDLETYEGINGDRRWAGVFEEGTGKYALYRNFDFQGFHDKWDELNADGYRLIDIETYRGNNGTRLWAGVWRSGNDGYALYRGYTTSEFNTKWTELSGQNYRLVDVEAYRTSGGDLRWAGVWREGSDAHRLNRNWRFCGWQDKHETAQGNGLELLDLERYE